MARKILIQRKGNSHPVLTERRVNEEVELQKLIKEHPDLLPAEELGMGDSVMVIGRETVLPSGAIDLVAVSKNGDLLIVEFKTGPENTDFRRVVAQLLDYGSDLWQMKYEEFEATVARRYFESRECLDDRVRNRTSLVDAARSVWEGMLEGELGEFRSRIAGQLQTGAFRYAVVAQRFTGSVESTIRYLNAISNGAQFYAVELVRFVNDGSTADALSAFEARTVIGPTPRRGDTSTGSDGMNRDRLLEQVESEPYREALREILEVCNGLRLAFNWGAAGVSIRLRTTDRAEPLSIGWLNPPGVSGWMGLRDLTLGFDTSSAKSVPSVAAALDEYIAKIKALPGAETVSTKGLKAYHLKPETVSRNRALLTEILARLVQQAEGSAPDETSV